MTDQRSTGDVLKDLLQQITRILRGEVALARAEVGQSVREAGRGIALVVAAVVIALSALNVLSAALVTALVELGLTPMWAAAAVAALLCAVALIFAVLGIRKLQPSHLAPDKTVENVRRDADRIKEIFDNGSSD
ncbi:phage holin family protein [Defluviimonas sp. WL0002]|uniref:Phage holin family protein n=1 Tax=Albidovulum marisflavi TaxID=2984159 RepID=A0ABT2ZDN5_9RHOB|nr:phage holin family protein [Defluviimonas sp. WL0002]MCV2868861.1 phage holin family protein [Defluviimonas sp. WL0002]